MTRQELVCKMVEKMISDIELVKKKNADYSSDTDALENFRDFGARGIVVRLGDKYHRLKTFATTGQYAVKEEGFTDTLRDIRIYSYLADIMFENEK